MIRVVLPQLLADLARVAGEVRVEVEPPVTLGRTWDALEAAHPALRGTFRDRVTGTRRPFVRFYACGTDLSRDPPELLLPPAIVEGSEALHVVGAMAGG